MKYLTILFISITLLFNFNGCGGSSTGNSANGSSIMSQSDQILQNAFNTKQQDIQVQGEGKVTKLLADDTIGDKHQKFIIKLASGLTLLISHNIDIAVRIDTLKVGDTIEFYGEYVWNVKGGLVHWTHIDPKGEHIDGYLKHDHIFYQ